MDEDKVERATRDVKLEKLKEIRCPMCEGFPDIISIRNEGKMTITSKLWCPVDNVWVEIPDPKREELKGRFGHSNIWVTDIFGRKIKEDEK